MIQQEELVLDQQPPTDALLLLASQNVAQVLDTGHITSEVKEVIVGTYIDTVYHLQMPLSLLVEETEHNKRMEEHIAHRRPQQMELEEASFQGAREHDPLFRDTYQHAGFDLRASLPVGTQSEFDHITGNAFMQPIEEGYVAVDIRSRHYTEEKEEILSRMRSFVGRYALRKTVSIKEALSI